MKEHIPEEAKGFLLKFEKEFIAETKEKLLESYFSGDLLKTEAAIDMFQKVREMIKLEKVDKTQLTEIAYNIIFHSKHFSLLTANSALALIQKRIYNTDL